MRKVNWTTVLVFSIVVLLAFMVGTGLLGGRGYGGWGMMGPGMMGGWGYSPLGWIGMILMWLVPVGFIVLTVLGIVWLVRNLGSHTPLAPGRACPHCGQAVQADWQNCPHCGTSLK
jgi:hypothetical protein